MTTSTQLRILHLIPSFAGGGAERQLSLLAPALAARGIDCHIAFNSGGTNLERIKNSPVSLHQLPKRSNSHPARVADLVRLIRDIRPDIVQTWLTQMDIMGAIAATICGLPYILSERASSAAYPVSWKNKLRSFIGRHAEIIAANSTTGAIYWQAQGATRPVVVIPNAIVGDCNTEEPREAAHLPSSKILLSAGRFAEEKNNECLIEGLDLALGQLPDHHAIIFGDGPLRSAVEAHVTNAKNAARFYLPGYSEHLAYWRKRADVFVSVSHQEGHPNVVLEAANEGCPLVLSDIMGHRECLSEGSAIWVDKDSPSSIAEGAIRAALDTRLTNRMTKSASADVSRFTLAAQVDQYCQLYRTVLNRQNRLVDIPDEDQRLAL